MTNVEAQRKEEAVHLSDERRGISVQFAHSQVLRAQGLQRPRYKVERDLKGVCTHTASEGPGLARCSSRKPF